MPQRQCPHCRGRILEATQLDDAEIDVCVGCGGLWFDAGELAKTIQRYDATLAPGGLVADSLGDFRRRTDLDCPACHEKLLEHALSEQNPVAIDVCPSCNGVWLDRGELAQAQAGHQFQGARERIDAGQTLGHWVFQFFSQLPVEFNFRPRRAPLLTWSLIALNCFLFLAQLTLPDWDALFRQLGVTPSLAPSVPWIPTLITSAFLHVNAIHLAGNMYFLWILGDNVEDVMGRPAYLAFYLVTAIGAGIASSLSPLEPDMPRVGASGAVSGLLAAYVVLFRRSGLTFMFFILQFKVSSSMYVAIWVAFNVAGFLTSAPNVAWAGHLGGFLVGLLVALAAYPALLRRDPLLRMLNRSRPVKTRAPWSRV